jgi:hypothetical protein
MALVTVRKRADAAPKGRRHLRNFNHLPKLIVDMKTNGSSEVLPILPTASPQLPPPHRSGCDQNWE